MVLTCLTAEAAKLKKVKLGKRTIEGVVTEVIPLTPIRLPGLTVNTGTDHIVTVSSSGQEYECTLWGWPDESLTAGNRIKLSGNVTEHRDPETNEVKKVEIGSCKMLEHSPTERSMPKEVEGVIISKGDTPEFGIIRFTLRSKSGLQYICSVHPALDADIRAVSASIAMDTYRTYRKGDKLVVGGFPTLPVDGVSKVHACSVISHEDGE